MSQSSTLSRSFPTVKSLTAPARWLFRSRRRVLSATAMVLAIIAAPVLWWSFQLWGLPDVGHLLDAGGSRAIPEHRSAVVLYRRAEERYRSSGPPIRFDRASLATWSTAPKGLRRLVEENREALALYREAAERPDTAPAPERVHRGRSMLDELALLEAARLEDRGEMAAAWGWYRAALRTLYHESAYASFTRRSAAQYHYEELRPRLKKWSADRRTTAAMIRQALDDVIACRSLRPPSDSFSIEAEYLDPDNPMPRVTVKKWNEIFAIPEHYVSPEQMQAIYDLWRLWHREPERSRRVLRLALANWLAYHRLPAGRRPAADLKVTGSYDFYSFGPEAPAEARALSPQALDWWLATSPEARQFLDWWTRYRGIRIIDEWIGELPARERANRRALLVLLAGELYRRDHKADPPTDEALVGPYLESLPDDGTEGAGIRNSTGQE